MCPKLSNKLGVEVYAVLHDVSVGGVQGLGAIFQSASCPPTQQESLMTSSCVTRQLVNQRCCRKPFWYHHSQPGDTKPNVHIPSTSFSTVRMVVVWLLLVMTFPGPGVKVCTCPITPVVMHGQYQVPGL